MVDKNTYAELDALLAKITEDELQNAREGLAIEGLSLAQIIFASMLKQVEDVEKAQRK